MTVHVMLDLETWGTAPGCGIRSIGACTFDLDHRFYIAIDDESNDMMRDPSTVQWWAEQSEAARSAFSNPVPLDQALDAFTDWYALVGGERIWGHGSHFDIPILAAAYHFIDRKEPWHYRAPRDTRTAFDMAGITDHNAWLDKHSEGGTHHNALDDALCQARAVSAALCL